MDPPGAGASSAGRGRRPSRRDGQTPSPSSALLQAEYQAWRDHLPDSLANSRTAELLEGICDIDLDALDVELPRGFGRD